MRYYLLAFSLLLSSCSSVTNTIGKVSATGSVEDQINYHQDQIRKYKNKVVQEEQSVQRSISRQDMGDVKRSNERKAKYVEKIEEHAKELKRLKAKKSDMISLVAMRSELEDREDVRAIDSEISSLNQLREYYVKKAGRARERGTRLQYQGFLVEAQQKMDEANEYDDIVKKLEAKIGQLQLQRDAIIRQNTTLPLSQS